MTTFEQLDFKPLREGVGARIHFANGYGASVVRHDYSYGGKEGLYELAVLSGDAICYDTPITSDVLGWLEPASVTDLLRQIEALEAA